MSQAARDGGIELGRITHPLGGPSESSCNRDEIGQRFGVAVAVTPAVIEFLPLTHHAHVTVVRQHNLDRGAMLSRGRQLLNVHQHRRVTADANDRFIRVRDLRSDGCRQAVTHGAGAARSQPAIGFVETQVLCRPHLVLTDIGRDNGVLVCQRRTNGSHQLLRNDVVLAGFEAQ